MKIKRDDKVKVISGNHKGKEGIVKQVLNDKNKVLVEGVNIVKKHVKPNQENQGGGIIEKEAFMDASNVMIVCASCSKTTRISIKRDEEGSRVRLCKSCNKPL